MGLNTAMKYSRNTTDDVLQGYDIIVQAQTGTVKTAGFLIAMIFTLGLDFSRLPVEENALQFLPAV